MQGVKSIAKINKNKLYFFFLYIKNDLLNPGFLSYFSGDKTAGSFLKRNLKNLW